MTSRTPPYKLFNHGFSREANPSASPATVQTDKASNDPFSPWSVARGSDLTSSNENTPVRCHVSCQSSKENDPSKNISEATATSRARQGSTGRGEQQSPCALRSISNDDYHQPGSQEFPFMYQSRRLPDMSNEICPSLGRSLRNSSVDTIKPISSIAGEPSSRSIGASLSSSNPSFDGAGATWLPGVFQDGGAGAAPIYFQPMSNLMATDTLNQPVPRALADLDLNKLPRSVFDGLAASMQRIRLDGIGLGLNDTEVGPVARIQRHFSPYYQGDIFLPANQSENIPDDLNCSLFIVNLPPSLTTHELLGAIHKLGPLGRIFAIHINDPEIQRNHPGCAAKVVFFKREVAHKFFTKCELHGFRVNGQHARVMWNRIKTSEKPHLANSDASRVLLIGGPPSIVNSSTLTDFFHTKLEFQIDSVITHVQGSVGNEDAVVEYRFGSFRCQAQAAKMALARELPHIRCFFGKDPLEPEIYRPFEYFNFPGNP